MSRKIHLQQFVEHYMTVNKDCSVFVDYRLAFSQILQTHSYAMDEQQRCFSAEHVA